MAPKKELSKEIRAKIVALKSEGYSHRQIRDELNVSVGVVTSTLKRLKETTSYENRPRSGRPRVSTPRDDRNLLNLARKNSQMSSNELAAQWTLASGLKAAARTVRSRLSEARKNGTIRKKSIVPVKQEDSNEPHGSMEANEMRI